MLPDVFGPLIQPTRQEVFFFGTPPGDSRFDEGTLPCWIDNGRELFYGIPGNRWRGFKIADDTRGPAFDPTVGERLPSAEQVTAARRYLSRRFPALKSAPLLEARVCQYENSPDGHYIIDRLPSLGNAWAIGGGSGHGFKMGPALGELTAQLVLEDQKADPFFRLERFSTRSRRGATYSLPGLLQREAPRYGQQVAQRVTIYVGPDGPARSDTAGNSQSGSRCPAHPRAATHAPRART